MSLRWRYDYLRGTEQCVVLIGVTSKSAEMVKLKEM